MNERWPMKVHRVFSRWSKTAELVPEWMWGAHMLLAAIAAITITIKFGLPLWGGLVAFALGTVALTAGLFHRVGAVVVTILGTLVAIGMGAIGLGIIFGAILVRVLGQTDLTLYLSGGLGALVGLLLAIASYLPFLRGLRRLPPSNA